MNNVKHFLYDLFEKILRFYLLFHLLQKITSMLSPSQNFSMYISHYKEDWVILNKKAQWSIT